MSEKRGNKFHGNKCRSCGKTERYANSRKCVYCVKVKRQNKNEKKQYHDVLKATKHIPPNRLFRSKDWPSHTNEYDENVPHDPIWVMFYRGQEIGECD